MTVNAASPRLIQIEALGELVPGRSHLLDRNHISVRTTPAGLSLGIIFTSLISYFYCGSRSMLFMSIGGSIPRIKPDHAVSFGDAIFAFAKVCDHTINSIYLIYI